MAALIFYKRGNRYGLWYEPEATLNHFKANGGGIALGGSVPLLDENANQVYNFDTDVLTVLWITGYGWTEYAEKDFLMHPLYARQDNFNTDETIQNLLYNKIVGYSEDFRKVTLDYEPVVETEETTVIAKNLKEKLTVDSTVIKSAGLPLLAEASAINFDFSKSLEETNNILGNCLSNYCDLEMAQSTAGMTEEEVEAMFSAMDEAGNSDMIPGTCAMILVGLGMGVRLDSSENAGFRDFIATKLASEDTLIAIIATTTEHSSHDDTFVSFCPNLMVVLFDKTAADFESFYSAFANKDLYSEDMDTANQALDDILNSTGSVVVYNSDDGWISPLKGGAFKLVFAASGDLEEELSSFETAEEREEAINIELEIGETLKPIMYSGTFINTALTKDEVTAIIKSCSTSGNTDIFKCSKIKQEEPERPIIA